MGILSEGKMVLRQTTHFSCPKCKRQDLDGFEEKVVVKLTPSRNGAEGQFELTGRKQILICRACSHVLREVSLPL